MTWTKKKSMHLPDKFDALILNQLGTSFSSFKTALAEVPPTSIRVNPFKYSEKPLLESVPWCDFGYYLTQRPLFTLDPLFHAGGYYVQEASSMFIFHILNQLNLNKAELRILDLCAAPGGKSALIGAYLQGEGLLVANEVVKSRAHVLKYNMSKEGHPNILVTNSDATAFTALKSYFDIILVDAPCSGEGMFRKDPRAILEWSQDNVELCCKRQKTIMENVLPALKTGGHLIYSTCTYNQHENIDNVSWATESLGLECVKIDVPEHWGIMDINKKGVYGYQFYPHRLKGEGFFTSVLQKTATESHLRLPFNYNKNFKSLDKLKTEFVHEWVDASALEFFTDITGTIHVVPKELMEEIHLISKFVKLIYCGITAGEFNKNVFIPDHSLALSLIIRKDIPRVELPLDLALLYLKRELQGIDSSQLSWLLATFNGQGLGWLKNLGNRINNYLPKEYRIHMNLG